MHLLPREEQKLLLHAVGSIAQKRLARGVKLNLTEATGLVASVSQSNIPSIRILFNPSSLVRWVSPNQIG